MNLVSNSLQTAKIEKILKKAEFSKVKVLG